MKLLEISSWADTPHSYITEGTLKQLIAGVVVQAQAAMTKIPKSILANAKTQRLLAYASTSEIDLLKDDKWWGAVSAAYKLNAATCDAVKKAVTAKTARLRLLVTDVVKQATDELAAEKAKPKDNALVRSKGKKAKDVAAAQQALIQLINGIKTNQNQVDKDTLIHQLSTLVPLLTPTSEAANFLAAASDRLMMEGIADAIVGMLTSSGRQRLAASYIQKMLNKLTAAMALELIASKLKTKPIKQPITQAST